MNTVAAIPGEVLAAFGVTPVRDLGGRRDDHWLARRGGAQVVLRRYATRPFGDIGYELDILQWLHARGWPVPLPLEPTLEVAGRTWCIFDWLPGAQRAESGETEQRARGRLLATLHHDLEAIVDRGQRGGCSDSHEIVFDDDLTTQVRGYERFFPDEARIMRWHLDRARELFEQLDISSARRTVLHSDFTPWNILYCDTQLSGILDFETTHLNFAVADFALAWRGRDDAVIIGYDEVRPLTGLDWALLVPVHWSWMFLGVADAIRDMQSGRAEPRPLEWTVTQLLRRTPLMGGEAHPYNDAESHL